MNGRTTKLRLQLRRLGWEIHRADPSRSLGEHLWYLFPELGINCVLDVGARVGEYGHFLRRNGYTGHIISFEPIRENFEILTKSCRADGNWTAYNYALGRVSAMAEMNVMSSTCYSSFLVPRAEQSATFSLNKVVRTEVVAIKRLDEILEDITRSIDSRRIYLKIKTQGWDLEVINGAEHCLTDIVAIQSEMSVSPLYERAVEFKEALAEFGRFGFAISGIFNGAHHDDYRLAEFDCVMVRCPASA